MYSVPTVMYSVPIVMYSVPRIKAGVLLQTA